DAIVALLDRDAIADPAFGAAVAAIHGGDVRELERLLDSEPRLLRERNAGPDVYRRATRPDYFRDPKLVWYVANNPETTARMAPNVVEIAGVMLARGIDRDDLETTLGLVASSSSAREQGHQRALIRVLLDAGARATRETILVAAAHGELDALRAFLDFGSAMDAPIAAAFGDTAALARLVSDANADDVREAFGLAVINRHVEAARIALDAGADVDAFLPVHAHGTALHHAAGVDDVPMLKLLLARGARSDLRDTLWDGTALDWASFAGHDEARTILAHRA
ncbi:MAG: ankyrin repeat domain-containing protein, partial [Candidatus Eremiobacteraeota bacterium]|nr:ankyrin repeat domain-containing protein [Candidatus Eremiobacteraeota bacterium]